MRVTSIWHWPLYYGILFAVKAGWTQSIRQVELIHILEILSPPDRLLPKMTTEVNKIKRSLSGSVEVAFLHIETYLDKVSIKRLKEFKELIDKMINVNENANAVNVGRKNIADYIIRRENRKS